MAPVTQGYRLEMARSHAVLRLDPEMGSAAWGDIDRVGNELISSVNGQGSQAWLIDLSRLEYMGSALVALVVRVWKAVQSSGGRVVVVCGSGMPEEVLRLAGLDKVWTITETYEDGLRKLGVSASGALARTGPGAGFPLLAVLAAACAVVAGIAVALVLSGSAVNRDLLVAGLYGGSVAAVVLGAVSVFKEQSWGRWLGGAMAVAGIALAVAGYSKLSPSTPAPAPQQQDTPQNPEAATGSASSRPFSLKDAHA